MSENMKLLSVLLVTDDETGAGDSGDFDYSIPMNGWMDQRRENRPALAKFLRGLADDIENGDVGGIPKPEPIPETPGERARIEAEAERAFGPIRRAMGYTHEDETRNFCGDAANDPEATDRLSASAPGVREAAELDADEINRLLEEGRKMAATLNLGGMLVVAPETMGRIVSLCTLRLGAPGKAEIDVFDENARLTKERDAALAERDEARKLRELAEVSLQTTTNLLAIAASERDTLRSALSTAQAREEEVKRLRAALLLCSRRCGDLHHEPSDRHGSGVACPVEARIDAALKEPRHG